MPPHTTTHISMHMCMPIRTPTTPHSQPRVERDHSVVKFEYFHVLDLVHEDAEAAKQLQKIRYMESETAVSRWWPSALERLLSRAAALTRSSCSAGIASGSLS